MMKVYVLQLETDGEGSSVVGVHATLRGAEAAALTWENATLKRSWRPRPPRDSLTWEPVGKGSWQAYDVTAADSMRIDETEVEP